MIAYHVTKTEEAYKAILETGILLPGRNVGTKKIEGVHLSLTPFTPGCFALHVICGHKVPAWILTVEIADMVELEPDPSGEDGIYGGKWVIHREPLTVKVLSATYITEVYAWEHRRPNSQHKLF